MLMRRTIKGDHIILGTGIDLVKIERFVPWLGYSPYRLSKIFTQSELVVFLNETKEDKRFENSLRAHRKATYFASRFAAKEAFFKAISAVLVSRNSTKHQIGLMFVCQHVEVTKVTWDVPVLQVKWAAFEKKIGSRLSHLQTHLSLSHEHDYAMAQVLLSL